MDVLSRVNKVNLIPSVSPYAFQYLQDDRLCAFYSKLSTDDIMEDLEKRTEAHVLVLVDCQIDIPQISFECLENLEMLIILRCQLDSLPSSENLTYVTYLDLSLNGLSNFPTEISHLRMLRVLKIAENRITHIPSAIVSLEFLQVLDISHNSVTYLPQEICSLSSLIYFDCSFNSLFKLPSNISNLEHLEVLYLAGNMLASLPRSFSLLKRLQFLNLNSNRFEYIPFCVFECTSLRELNFSYNQASGVMPDNLCRLVNLENLSLAFNKFTKLPGKLANLSKLKALNLKGNEIQRLPEEILSRCKDLKLLNCASCGLSSVPDSLRDCKNLQVLDLSHNSLENLPSEGVALRNLKALYFVDNKISTLPKWINDLEYVINLSLGRNLLQDLPCEFFQSAERLRFLDISYNQFETLPLCIFSKASRLIYFLVDHNPLVRIPPEIANLNYLTHLSIANCPYLYELPDEIGSLYKLQSLRICANSLLKLPPTLHRLENLKYLDLSDNKFSRFPVVVCFIPHLKVFLCNNCCHSCTYLEPDPPGWFERTSLIDPEASMEKLGKDYMEEAAPPSEEKPITLEEALRAEEEATKVAHVNPEEISNLVFQRRPHVIPKFIHYLRFLVHISLQNNGLYHLPDVFDRFKHLERIYLNDNNLRKIPNSIGACQRLRTLELRNNKLKEINVPLQKLPNLRHLELDGNDFPTSLREVIRHSNLKGLFSYLESLENHSKAVLRRMCERLITLVGPEDWQSILQLLGLSEDTVEHIEDELPGGYNFSRRVARALEYWSGLPLCSSPASSPLPGVNILETPPTTDQIDRTPASPTLVGVIDSERVAPPTPTPRSIRFHFEPRLSGPKATPERLVYILKLLDLTELGAVMRGILEKSYICQF